MTFENVLVVAAHPDDEVLGVGGTIPLIKQHGGRVTVVIVTDGSSTQYQEDTEILLSKRQQARDANRILGTDELVEWDFPDMRLDTVEHYRLNAAFEQIIQDHQYDTVFVQNGDDINLDHQLIYKSVLVATRPIPGQSVRSILSYQVNSSTEWGGRTQTTIFCPNYYVDIGNTIRTKLAAMRKYTAELRDTPHPRSIRALRQRAAVSGSEVGFAYCEPFKLLLYRGSVGQFPSVQQRRVA